MANPDDPTDGPVKSRSNEWRSELFLHPGDWVPWVGAAVICTVLVLGMTVVGLNEKEKVSTVRVCVGWGMYNGC